MLERPHLSGVPDGSPGAGPSPVQGPVHQILLREREAGQWLAKYLPFLGVAQGRFVGITGCTHDPPRDPLPGLIRAFQRAPGTFCAWKPRQCTYPHRIEDNIALNSSLHGEFAGNRVSSEPRSIGGNYKAAHATVGHRLDNGNVGCTRQANPPRATGDGPVGIGIGAGACPPEIRSL